MENVEKDGIRNDFMKVFAACLILLIVVLSLTPIGVEFFAIASMFLCVFFIMQAFFNKHLKP